MGEAVVGALRGLTFWQGSFLLLLLLGMVGGAYGIYYWMTDSDEALLSENQGLVQVVTGDLASQVDISGSVLFPTRETLTFSSRGVIEDILVEKGDTVAMGDVIATLDVETLATLREELDAARVGLQQAREALDDALAVQYTPLQAAQAEEKIVEARLTLRNLEQELADLLELPDYDDEITQAESDIEGARLDVAKAADAVADINAAVDPDAVAAAKARIDSMETSLRNGTLDLDLARDDWDDRLAAAQDSVDDALKSYREVVTRWLGAEVTEAAAALSPQALLESWGTDLASLFTPPPREPYRILDLSGFVEDPETPWSEPVVEGRRVFFSAYYVIDCDDDTALLPNQSCIAKQLDAAWEAYAAAQEAAEDVDAEAVAALAKVEASVDSARDAVSDAQAALESLYDAPDPLDVESAQFGVKRARLALDNAVAKRGDLLEMAAERPDPVDVAAKEQQIATARVAVEQAKSDLEELMEPVDPLVITLRESQVVSAGIALEAAQARLDTAVITAPWDGRVADVLQEKGDEITANAPIVEIVDPTIVEIDGIVDEIDVLSVPVGARATVLMDALPGQLLTGVVASIDPGAGNQQGVVTYPVRVRVTVPAGLALIEGLSAVAQVVVRQDTGLLAPLQAIRGSFTDPYALVWTEGGLVERPVTLGIGDDFWTIVTSGLAEGDNVVMDTPEDQGFFFGPGGGSFRAVPGGFRGR